MGLIPDPNFPAPGGSNYQVFRAGTGDRTKYHTKIDYNYDERNTIYGTYNFGNRKNLKLGTPLQITDYQTVENDRTLTLGYTRILSSTLLNELRFSYTWWHDGDEFASYNSDKNYAKEWGIWDRNPSAKGTPSIVLFGNGNTDYLGNYGIPNTHDNNNLIFKDSLLWRRGAHSFNFGGDFNHQKFDWLYDLSAMGVYYVGLLEGLDPAWTVTGSPWSTLLMGLSPYQLYSGQAARTQKYRRNVFGFWAQDDWKVSPRLTLNIGVRYDYLAPFEEITHNFTTFNANTGKIVFAAGAPPDIVALAQYPHESGGPSRPYEPNKTDFAPRLGFAFRPLKNDDKTVLRGGYGIFYAAETAQYTTYGSWVQPFGGYFDYAAAPGLAPDGIDRLQPISSEPIDFSKALGKTPGLAYLTAPKVPSTYIQQWNLALERELAPGLIGEVAYVGSKGTHLSSIIGAGAYDPSIITKVNQVYGGTWGGPTFFIQESNSKYNSLQAKLKGDIKGDSFLTGLSFLASYSWGRALAESSNEEFNHNVVADKVAQGNIIKRQYGLADFDINQRFIVSGNYPIPVGRNLRFGSDMNGIANSILGGWSTHWIATFQGGFPYTVLTNAGRLPDRICDGTLPSNQRTADHWFDYTCFPTHPSTFVPDPNNPGQTIETDFQGNAGINVIRTDNFYSVDVGIFKNFHVTENLGLQFRFDAFNVFNHPNLTYPSGYNNFYNTASGATIIGQNDNRDIEFALKVLF